MVLLFVGRSPYAILYFWLVIYAAVFFGRWATALRYALAAAACLVIGFVAGRVLETPAVRELTQLNPAAHDSLYRVAWDTYWKVLAENFLESYHLPVCHAGTIGSARAQSSAT